MDIATQIEQLQSLIPHTETKDRFFLNRDLNRIKRDRLTEENDRFTTLKTRIVESAERVKIRQGNLPQKLADFHYDGNLPIVQERKAILEAIRENQVTVICGETGSGKTTQLAKMCMELGYGARGLIGHTQPRRIAARSVAARVAEELKKPLGEFVGYKMRFDDKTHDDTVLKLMTDGILLTELGRDRFLNQYEVIIIDEAHERSLNIDFLLGILKDILPRRPDLKLIITSATIDPETFAKYFSRNGKEAPIIEVSGRTYPVEMRYRPLMDLEGKAEEEYTNSDQQEIGDAIVDAVNELSAEGLGDILIFLSGEREIRETADLLRDKFQNRFEILPLFSRLSQQEQNRIFSQSNGRRIVLSTNVAETSLTVPGIKYVIDPGFARVSRYSARSRLQSLLVEPISQASANQRAGRCGRVSEGICIRLYSEEDYESRPEFLDPEILRTHLASVILQMGHLRLGDPEKFPFVEAPESRQIREGFQTLRELKAVRHNGRLTRLGNQLARLPIDPRFGAMLLAGIERGVGHELLVMVAFLSIQDPRERPMEYQQQSDQKHQLFKNENSDFISLLNLWGWYQANESAMSQSQLRRLCRQYFLNYMRMREWYDLYRQITQIIRGLKLNINPYPESTGANNEKEQNFPKYSEDLIHQSILTGLLDQIGLLGEEYLYSGSNNRKFRIFPGSFLFKKPPNWIMAMEIVETSQVFARICARINPEWLESIAAHLIRKQYTEPHWSKNQGQAAAYETLTLSGLRIIENRLVSFGSIEPALSRELMIREGLVQGDIEIRAPFYRHNLKEIEAVELMEEKTRRRDILVEEWRLFEFYNERIPEDCYSVAALNRWCRKRENNAKLTFTKEQILAQEDDLNLEEFPETIQFGNLTLNAVYLFDPADEHDGMTLLVPIAALNLLDKTRLDWLVKGLIEEKITEVMRTMPRALRRNFVPLPDIAKEIASTLEFGEGNLYYKLSEFLTKRSGVTIEPHEFDETRIPKHLRMNIRVIDSGGKTLGESRDLKELTERFRARAETAFQKLAQSGPDTQKARKRRGKKVQEATEQQANIEKARAETFDSSRALDLNEWVIEEEVRFNRNGIELIGYPALVYHKNGELRMELFDRENVAYSRHLEALVHLSLKALNEQIKYLRRQWPHFGKLALLFRQVGNEDALKEDLMRAVIKDGMEAQTLPRDSKTFNTIIQNLRGSIVKQATDLSNLIIEIFENLKNVRETLNGLHPMNKALIEKIVKAHCDRLVHLNFISETPQAWRQHIPRYLEALALRIERFPQNIERDRENEAIIQSHWENYQQARRFFEKREESDPRVIHYRWLIEELAVSLFSQPIRTAETVSPKRLNQLWKEIDLTIKNSDYR